MGENAQWKEKDPDAVLDFFVNWEDWLAAGETISTSTWTVSTGISKGSTSATSTVATVWLSGGTAGVTYTATNRIVTSAGRTDERSLMIEVKQR